MIGEATTGELSPTGSNGDKFDVFLSLRDGAGGEEFSSGIDDIGEEATAGVNEAAGKLDLVAVASGEKKLPPTEEVSASIGQTACVTCVGCPFLSQCIKPQALAVKQESESQDKLSDDMSYAGEEAVPNLMEITPKQSYLERLLAPDDFNSLDENGRGELVMAGYSEPTDYQESITKKVPEPVVAEAKPIDLTTKTDEPTEQIVQQKRETKISTNQTVEVSGKGVDIEATETPFFELKTAPEIAADDTTDAGEALPESASKVFSDTSGEEHFTEPTEENRPSIEIKQQTFDVISGAADKENQQPAFESSEIPTRTKTRTVLSSPAVSEDTQTGDKSCNSLENETVYSMASEDKVTASVVKNTYDGDDAAAVSDIKPSSIEHPKENNVVAAAPKLSDSEPRQMAAISFTSASEQRSAAQFDATGIDKLPSGSIDGSNAKPLQNAQPREAKLGMAAGYDDSIQTLDGADNEQPGNLTPDVDDVLLPQERTVAASVPAEYDKNETYQLPSSYSIDQSDRAPQAILSQEQMIVESGEDSLNIGDRADFDNNLAQPKIDDVETDVFVANDVVNTTNKTDMAASVEMIDIAPNLPDKHTAVDRNDTQLAVDLPQKLGDELAVDTDASEPQIPVFRQLDCSDTTMDISRSEDKIWAEEEVFFVKQDLPVVESKLTLTEVAAVISPAEVVTAREKADNLKLSVDDEIGIDMDSVGQLDNFKTSSVSEIANDYEPVEQIAIPVSPSIEPISDVELDEPTVEISEERIMPREEHDSIVMEVSEKSDLPRVDDEVEAIITDTSDVEPTIDLLEEQEELAANEVSEAVESELDEQNDLAVDSYGYNSETSTVSDNVLVVKSRQSPGLWPDDSRLNPEEESASMAQSSADDTSLVSRLVGMFVVAMCVVRGRQSVKV
ncbi:MAG: hypothetical protein D8G53_12640 [Candidatus Saccharimonas sp.]|nr:MAG: hypothetical protein D8G53_12640 [Candidatus Saccharimonas sp.]